MWCIFSLDMQLYRAKDAKEKANAATERHRKTDCVKSVVQKRSSPRRFIAARTMLVERGRVCWAGLEKTLVIPFMVSWTRGFFDGESNPES